MNRVGSVKQGRYQSMLKAQHFLVQPCTDISLYENCAILYKVGAFLCYQLSVKSIENRSASNGPSSPCKHVG